MILHLVDDEKIINRTIELFNEALHGENYFICFLHGDSPKLVSPKDNLFFYDGTEIPFIDFKKVNKVVIHYLDYWKVCFCNKYLTQKTKIYWILWGADLYNSLLANRGYKLLYSRKFYPIKANLTWLVGRLGYHGKWEKSILDFISNRINYFLCDCRNEYLLFQKYLPTQTKKICYHELFYYPINEILGPHLIGKWVSGNKILLGNSASFTNNHEYVLKILSRCSLDNKTIISPISYGGSNKYKQHIKHLGKKLLGSHFQPLETFLPLEKYNQLMLSAEICIYGSWRQEAIGNIVIALYLGAKVFLSKYSPLLLWYRKMGVTIYELESINDEQLKIPLTIDQKERNRDILQKRYNKTRMLTLIRECFS